jgi:hypothetical protein
LPQHNSRNRVALVAVVQRARVKMRALALILKKNPGCELDRAGEKYFLRTVQSNVTFKGNFSRTQ